MNLIVTDFVKKHIIDGDAEKTGLMIRKKGKTYLQYDAIQISPVAGLPEISFWLRNKKIAFVQTDKPIDIGDSITIANLHGFSEVHIV